MKKPQVSTTNTQGTFNSEASHCPNCSVEPWQMRLFWMLNVGSWNLTHRFFHHCHREEML